jgi:hypothetical protein
MAFPFLQNVESSAIWSNGSSKNRKISKHGMECPPGSCRKRIYDTALQINSICELFSLEKFGAMKSFLWELEKAMGTAAWCREQICKNTNGVMHGAALPPKKRSISKSVTKVPDFIAMYQSACLRLSKIARKRKHGARGSRRLENGVFAPICTFPLPILVTLFDLSSSPTPGLATRKS